MSGSDESESYQVADSVAPCVAIEQVDEEELTDEQREAHKRKLAEKIITRNRSKTRYKKKESPYATASALNVIQADVSQFRDSDRFDQSVTTMTRGDGEGNEDGYSIYQSFTSQLEIQ